MIDRDSSATAGCSMMMPMMVVMMMMMTTVIMTMLCVHLALFHPSTEKNLDVLKKVMEEIPEARLAFVGDGPSRADLEEHFKDMDNVKFMVSRASLSLSFTPPPPPSPFLSSPPASPHQQRPREGLGGVARADLLLGKQE